MSIGSLGVIGGLSAVPLAQKGADVERSQQASIQQQRHVASEQKAESAAGIAETDSEQEVSERDADGRRLWEKMGGKKVAAPAAESAAPDVDPTHQSIDLTGESGGQLDLTG